jgi:PAS domain S-box-containing protein
METKLGKRHGPSEKVVEARAIDLDKTKKQLQHAEQKYRSLFEDAPVMYVITRNEKDFPIVVDCNKLFESTLGYRRDEILTRPLTDFYALKSRRALLEGGYKRALEGRFIAEERELLTRDGHVVQTLLRALPEIDSKGHISGTRAMFVDISEQKMAEAALEESEERYSILSRHVADGVTLIQDGRLLFVNEAFVSMCGFSNSRKIIGKEALDLISPEFREAFVQMLEALLSGAAKKRIFQARYIIADEREFWAEGHYNVIKWKGKPAVLATIRDVTDAKLREMAMKEEAEHFRSENLRLKSTLKDRYRFGDIIGKSPVMQEVYELVFKAAATNANVLILGESGTGKELVARAIHEMSNRSDEDFVPVNCGAIPENLFESEFFGHRKGSFTGAHMDKNGLFYSANKGTLFLDEVGEIALSMQIKLLRAIESGEYRMIGDTKPRTCDVRIIAATNRDLSDRVRRGVMRDDFYFRISIIPITIPPLRERKEDIPLLVFHFLNLYTDGKKRDIPGKVMEAIFNYDWPGNVRELESAIQRFVAVGRFDIKDLRVDFKESGVSQEYEEKSKDLRLAMKDFEKHYIERSLNANQWKRSKTAAALGIDPKTLYRKMKKIGLT